MDGERTKCYELSCGHRDGVKDERGHILPFSISQSFQPKGQERPNRRIYQHFHKRKDCETFQGQLYIITVEDKLDKT
ncbi:MAG: hypothetical protein ACPLPS_01685 [bacterium]